MVHGLCLLGICWLVCAGVFSAGCQSDRTPPSKADRGSQVYAEYCQRCHGSDGSGSTDVPDIRGRGIWQEKPDSVLFVLAFGMATNYSSDSVMRTMPPLPYNDADIAAVGRYVQQLIGKRKVAFTAEDVARVRNTHKRRLLERLQNVGQ